MTAATAERAGDKNDRTKDDNMNLMLDAQEFTRSYLDGAQPPVTADELADDYMNRL